MDKEELYENIVCEIARLSMIIVNDEMDIKNARGMAIIINHLSALLMGQQSISDFHDCISTAPEQVREYYYKLLYLVK